MQALEETLLVVTKELRWQLCFFPSTPPSPPPGRLSDNSFWLNSCVSYISVFPSHFLSPLLFPFHYTPPLRPCETPPHGSVFSPAPSPAQAVQTPWRPLFSLSWGADSSSSLSRTALAPGSHPCRQSERSDGPREIRKGVRRESPSVLGEKQRRREVRHVGLVWGKKFKYQVNENL